MDDASHGELGATSGGEPAALEVLTVTSDPRSVDDAAALLRGATDRHGLRCIGATPDQAEQALSDLVAQPDARVAVVGVGRAGDAAVRAAAGDGRIGALVLLSSPLPAATVALLADWPELPVLALADPADRPALRGAVDAYLASDHAASDLVVGPHGGALGGDAFDGAMRWLVERLAQVAAVDEVTVHADDGWDLFGTRWLPDRPEAVPGVVLLHSGRSDRAVFGRLERLLAERGLAVLNLDWRGRGRSTGRGSYFELSSEERAAGWRDAAAALDHLADCDGVDGSRLGAVGVIHGAEHAARAAVRDPRVRAITILTGYRPADDEEAAHLTGGAVDVLYVTSTDHRTTTDAMRALYEKSSSPRTRYVEYPGGAIGYQLFDLDPGLEPQIVAWLAEVLEA